jgi:hypothetical protein
LPISDVFSGACGDALADAVAIFISPLVITYSR